MTSWAAWRNPRATSAALLAGVFRSCVPLMNKTGTSEWMGERKGIKSGTCMKPGAADRDPGPA